MVSIFNISHCQPVVPSIADYLQGSFLNLNNTGRSCLCGDIPAATTTSWGKPAWETDDFLREQLKGFNAFKSSLGSDYLLDLGTPDSTAAYLGMYFKAAGMEQDAMAWGCEDLQADSLSSPSPSRRILKAGGGCTGKAAWPGLCDGDFEASGKLDKTVARVRDYLRSSPSLSPSASLNPLTTCSPINDANVWPRPHLEDPQGSPSAFDAPTPSLLTVSTPGAAISSWFKSKLTWSLGLICTFALFFLSVHVDLFAREQLDNAQLHQEFDVLQERFDDLWAQYASLKIENDSLKASNSPSAAGTNAQAGTEDLLARLRVLDHLYSAEQAHTTDLQARNHEMEVLLSDIQTRLPAHINNLEEHLADFDTLQAQHGALSQENADLLDHVSLLSTQNADLQNFLSGLRSHTTTMEQEVSVLQHETSSFAHTAANWRATLHALEASRAEAQTTITSLRTSLAAKESDLSAKEFELRNVLQTTQAQVQRCAEERESQVRRLTTAIQSRDLKLRTLEKVSAEWREEKSEWEALVAELMEEKGEMLGELGWLRYVVQEVGRFAQWEDEGFEEDEIVMVCGDGMVGDEEVLVDEDSEENEESQGDEVNYLMAAWGDSSEESEDGECEDEESEAVQPVEWDEEGFEEVVLDEMC